MAYSETEERLKVKGSEQITRDLKVNRDTFINNKLEAGRIESKGDLSVAGEVVAGNDVSISGDLYVNGTEYISNTETAQTTDNYLVLRHNQTGSLASGEHSGVAVHNYTLGKTATITADNAGTWRVADNTETDNNYTNVSYYDGTFYTGLTRTVASVVSGMKTAFDEDELDESVYYNTSYYHFDGSHWFPVSLVDNKLTLGSAVTDSTTITALNALTKEDLVYFRTLTITVINPVENQPLLTRSEVDDLSDNHILKWNSTNNKAIDSGVSATTANNVTCVTADQFCGALKGNADTATNATNATNADKGKNGNSYSAFGSNAFNSTAFTTCTGTVTSINIYCGTTCKCGITTSGNICLGTNAFNSTAFTTCTGTVTKVKVGTTEYSPSSGVVSLPAYPTSIACADKGKNGNSYSAFGSNAFNSTAFTTCTGTVTKVKVGTTEYSPTSGVISLPAYPSSPSCVACAGTINRTGYATAYDFDVALTNNSTTACGTTFYVSNSCRLKYCNTTGVLKGVAFCGALYGCACCAGRDGSGCAFGTAARCATSAFRSCTWWPNNLGCGCVHCAMEANSAKDSEYSYSHVGFCFPYTNNCNKEICGVCVCCYNCCYGCVCFCNTSQVPKIVTYRKFAGGWTCQGCLLFPGQNFGGGDCWCYYPSCNSFTIYEFN